MKKDIRLIALDMDGTTLNSKKELTPRVRSALLRALEAGIEVLPATGRQVSGLPPEVLALPGVRYAIVSNGAQVYDLAAGTPVYSNCFTRTAAEELLRTCRAYGAYPSLFIGGGCYSETNDYSAFAGLLPPATIAYLRASRQPVPDLIALLEASEAPAEKFTMFFLDPDARRQAMEAFAARGDVCATSSIAHNLELNAAGCSKGAALLALAERLGIAHQHLMAVGDATNDTDMLRAAGYGVAMGNAPPDVQALADAVTLSCDEDGVAHAIEQIL